MNIPPLSQATTQILVLFAAQRQSFQKIFIFIKLLHHDHLGSFVYWAEPPQTFYGILLFVIAG